MGTDCYGIQTGIEWVQTVMECRRGWSGYRLLWNADGDRVGTDCYGMQTGMEWVPTVLECRRDGVGTDCYGMQTGMEGVPTVMQCRRDKLTTVNSEVWENLILNIQTFT